MYKNIRSCIKTDACSEFFTCSIGVRQGENLSPLLFSIYLNDLEDFLKEKNNTGITLNNFTQDILPMLSICLLLYADDTILLSEDPVSFQKCIDDFTDYCRQWKFNINTDKTKVLIFGSRSNNHYNFKIGNDNIEIVDS